LLPGKIHSGKDFKALVHASLVLFFYAWKPLHVRLAETQEDPEVRVLRKSPYLADWKDKEER
jgi:hypothetical protein